MQPSIATQQSASVVQAAGRVGVMMAAATSDRAPASGKGALQSDDDAYATFPDFVASQVCIPGIDGGGRPKDGVQYVTTLASVETCKQPVVAGQPQESPAAVAQHHRVVQSVAMQLALSS
jgi:hypothetical protein